ncbi:MAG: EAL domain-containing protein [Pseudomonadota bacterium]
MIITLAATSAWAELPTAHTKPATEKVRLQLKWFHQFQFAGYYAAIEQGYYAAEGLDVEIKERELNKNFVKQVTSGEAEYGVGDSGLLSQYAQGEPITALAAIFQHNPLVFFSRQDSGIISPHEMIGKRVMTDTVSTNEAPLRLMLSGTGISEKDYHVIPQSNDYNLLVQGKVDVISGYITDEPFFFKEKGVKVNIINPQNYGVDFYGDILFTSKKEVHDHTGRAERFRRASLKGWTYALNHPEELIQIISKKYHSKLSIEHLRFEAAETRKLILPETIPLGQIEPSRIKMVADAYVNAGFNRPLAESELASFIYNKNADGLNLTDAEKTWLAAHPVIRVGIDHDFAPYEWVDKDGNYLGLAADYMRLLEKKLGVRFEIIKDKSWPDILNMAKHGELDMLSCAVKTPDRLQYLSFTEPYKSTRAIIIDSGQGGFIGSLDHLTNKRVAVEKGYFIQELLQKNYPSIRLILANNTQNALNLVLNGKADAYVGDAGTANYVIKKEGLLPLRFSGQTEYSSNHSVAFTRNNPELASIINKAMLSIPNAETDAIFNRWLGLRIEQGIKAETIVKYVVALALLLSFFGYWAYRMKREISTRKAAELREQSRSHIMESLATGMPLANLLEVIVKSVEQLHPNMICSILLLDNKGKHLVTGAAPSLPSTYNAALNGVRIGEGVGSCGTAAFTGKRVIVENISTHPYWAPYTALAATCKLGACWSQPIYASTGKVLGTFAIYHHEANSPSKSDIALIEQSARLASIAIERKQAETELKIAATAFQSQEGMIVTDANNVILRVNNAFTRVTGYSAEEAIGKTPQLLSSGRQDKVFFEKMWASINSIGTWEGEIWNRRKSGEIYPEHLTITAVKDMTGMVTNYVAALTDITKSKEASEEIKNLAFYDPLTRLPNRRLLMDRLKQALATSARSGQRGAVLFLDLDHFKTLNDTLGHDIGDFLLQQVAERLTACVREGDTIARIGGDEFVVLLEDLSDHDLEAATQTESIGDKILEALNQPYQLAAHEHYSTPSIGATLFSNHDTGMEALLKQADIAMYQAKDSGRNTLRFYDPAMQEAITARVNLEHELRKAIELKQFELYYQIQVNSAGHPLGAEALIRWQHPTRGLTSPFHFIHLAEETGLIVPIGLWVLETACAQLKSWQNNVMTRDLTLSVNVSAKQFLQTGFVAQVQAAIQRYDIDPMLLKLELTESILVDNIDNIIATMTTLGEMGIRFSLDDFGTGYSSLQYLKKLPLYQLKIDQSFVRDIVSDSSDRAIVRTIIAMAHILDLSVIAEGVETEEQRQRLLNKDCMHFQGYLFGKPMPIHEFEAKLKSN